MKRLLSILLLMSICCCQKLEAQTYYTVTHASGTQTIGPYSVTVTPINNPLTAFNCAGPYYIGTSINAYMYSFSSPITLLKVNIGVMHSTEIIRFYINGTPYIFTNGSFFPFVQSASTCSSGPGTLGPSAGGDITCVSGSVGNGQVRVSVPAGFDSVRIQHMNGTGGGSLYDFAFASDSFISITQPFNDTIYCAGDSVHVPYTVSGPFGTGNVFSLELSNAVGSFATPTVIGTLTSTTSGTVHGKLPVGVTPGTGYRLRISSGNPSRSSSDNGKNIWIKALPIPVATTNAPVCEGSTLGFTATGPGGSSYSWVGPSSFTSTLQFPTITSAATANSGDYIVTVNALGCIGKDTVNVQVKTMPAITTATSNGPLCEGNTLNLAATNTTTGVSYSWTGPGGFTSASQSPSIPGVTLTNAGLYSVTATLNGCTSAAGTTTLVIKPTPATPTAANNSPVCVGETLNFTSSSSTPGVSYSWTGPNSFTSTSQNPSKIGAPTDSGTYYVTATLNGCTSAAGTTHVDISPVTALGGWVSPNDTICEGTLATFVVVPTNPGPNPQYQWFRNGNLIAGATNTKYVTSNIATGDVFYCEMNAPNVCATTLHLTSNPIKMLVIPITLDPSVTISSVPAQPIPGQPATFTALSVNGGYIPAYQWKRNGQDVYGAIYAIWNANNLAPYDKISCSVTSSDPCAVPKGANSNELIVGFPTGVDALNGHGGMELYPNPNKGEFTLNIPRPSGTPFEGGIDVEVVNAVGQTVLNSKYQNPNSRIGITLPDVANGVYLLRVRMENGVKVLRFTVER